MATVRIPIDLRNPRTQTLAGNAYFTILSLTNQDLGLWNFVKDVDGRVYGVVNIPKNVSATENAKIVLIIGANATTGVTRLQVSSKAVAKDGESVNVTFTAETAQDVTVPATARLTKEVSFTLTDTDHIADDLLFVEIRHEGNHVNDTLAVDMELYDAYLEIDVT